MKILSLVVLLFIHLYSANISTENNPFQKYQELIHKNIYKDSKYKEELKKEYIIPPANVKYIDSVTVTYRYLDGTEKIKTTVINKKIDSNSKYIIINEDINSEKFNDLINLNGLNFIKIKVLKNKVYLLTKKDTLKTYFSALNRSINVLIKDDINDFLKNKYDLNSKYIKRIEVTNYEKYYKVEIFLKGVYKYYVNKMNNGIIIDIQ